MLVSYVDANHRIDLFLSSRFIDITRSRIKRLIIDGAVTVNKRQVKPHYKIRDGDEISIDIPPMIPLSNVEPEDIPLDIIFEDKHIIVINKASGMTVHPAAGKRTGTLVGALLFHCNDLSGIGGVERPGIVHRLDKGTSGIIVCAKSDKSHLSLTRQFKERTVKKIYTALVAGKVKRDKNRIEVPIGRHVKDRKKMSTITKKGKMAVTEYDAVERFENCTLLKVRIFTGRTHQIRVHLASEGYPVAGDKVYGKGSKKNSKLGVERLMLHAETIGFTHPATGEYMEFSAPLPEYFEKVLELLIKGQQNIDIRIFF